MILEVLGRRARGVGVRDLALVLVIAILVVREGMPIVRVAAGDVGPRAESEMGTSFTYQGSLVRDGTPAEGTFAFEFRLFDQEDGGVQKGQTINLPAVLVSGGLFTVLLDPGAEVFSGGRRWLQVRVSDDGGTTFELLGRQELTPAPYAIFAASAPWLGLEGTPAGFADGEDNDALGALDADDGCYEGNVPKWTGSEWVCAVDISGVSSGTPPVGN